MAAAVGVSVTSDAAGPNEGMDSKEPLGSEDTVCSLPPINEEETPPHEESGGQPTDEPSVESMREEMDRLKLVRWA